MKLSKPSYKDFKTKKEVEPVVDTVDYMQKSLSERLEEKLKERRKRSGIERTEDNDTEDEWREEDLLQANKTTKIKLSKSQWEYIGKKTGWNK